MNQTQGALSKQAKDATAAAEEATGKVGDDDGASHGRAADAHHDAAWKNRQAGNATQAKKHELVAKVHGEKAEAVRRAKYFADDQARAAEVLSTKAHKAAFGKDPEELRSEKQLHTDAAEAHGAAASAAKIAGQPRDAAYHADKSASHAALAKG